MREVVRKESRKRVDKMKEMIESMEQVWSRNIQYKEYPVETYGKPHDTYPIKTIL